MNNFFVSWLQTYIQSKTSKQILKTYHKLEQGI